MHNDRELNSVVIFVHTNVELLDGHYFVNICAEYHKFGYGIAMPKHLVANSMFS